MRIQSVGGVCSTNKTKGRFSWPGSQGSASHRCPNRFKEAGPKPAKAALFSNAQLMRQGPGQLTHARTIANGRKLAIVLNIVVPKCSPLLVRNLSQGFTQQTDGAALPASAGLYIVLIEAS